MAIGAGRLAPLRLAEEGVNKGDKASLGYYRQLLSRLKRGRKIKAGWVSALGPAR